MALRNDEQAYGSPAKWLHWSTVAAMAVVFALAWTMTELPRGPEKTMLYGLHKSFGVLVLALTAVRFAWRQINPVPAPRAEAPLLERRLARLVHAALYVLMVAVPLSGWVMSSAADRPVVVFGLLTLPSLVAPGEALKEAMEEVHEVLANGLLVMVVLHAAAAFKHHFLDRDDILRRMLPQAR